MRGLAVLVVALGLTSCSENLPPVLVPQPPMQLPGLSDLPTRTKAVRIFVVPDDVAKNSTAIVQFAVSRGATMNDVFIVGSEAMSFSFREKRLLPIIEAVKQDWEAIPFVDVFEREQLQWQSDHEFELTRIEKFNGQIDSSRPKWKQNFFKRGLPKETPTPRDPWTFEQNPSAPVNPFARLASLSKEAVRATAATGSTQMSIRSGIAKLEGGSLNSGQVYRLALAVTVDGKRREIAPGLLFYACPTVALNVKARTCHRRHVSPSDYPNRTKVVRLLIVDSKTAADRKALHDLVLRDSISESDVLIVNGEPKSYIHTNGLTDHEEALLDDHPVIYTMVQELEQLQWEANTDFVVSKVEKKPRQNGKATRRYKLLDWDQFDENPHAPMNPFSSFAIPKELNRQFSSGVATIPWATRWWSRHPLGQLYKMSFEMMIDGKRVSIDPDGYCDM